MCWTPLVKKVVATSYHGQLFVIIVLALACPLKPRAILAFVVLVVDMQLSMQSLYITNKVVG